LRPADRPDDNHAMMTRQEAKFPVVAAAAAVLLLGGMPPALAGVKQDVNARRPDSSTSLQWAAFAGDVGEAKRLIAAGADVNASTNYGINALLLAADIANTELIQLLLKHGADANSANPEGETALHLVARAGNVEAAKLLLKAGARIDPREMFGQQTPLMWAVARRHPAMVELLLAKGADADARGAIRDYQRVATAESRAKSMDRGGFTPLLYAARENCRACADALIRHGADLNLPDPSGVVAMVIAMINGNFDIAKALIAAGADVNQWDVAGQAPLHVAIAGLGGVRGSGNPLDADFPQQATMRELVQMLIERGANPNQQVSYQSAVRGAGGRGTTPFLVAVGTGNIELVKQLVASGANAKLATSEGQSAIHIAVQVRGGGRNSSQVELIKYLASLGADPHMVAERNWRYRTRGGSALHYAVRGGNQQVVQALLDLGVDINVKDEDGLTALDYAMARGHVAFMQQAQPPNKPLAEFLRSKGANVELDWAPEWPHDGAPLSTNAYDAKLWPVDPKGP
jgi:uncharacterized protein